MSYFHFYPQSALSNTNASSVSSSNFDEAPSCLPYQENFVPFGKNAKRPKLENGCLSRRGTCLTRPTKKFFRTDRTKIRRCFSEKVLGSSRSSTYFGSSTTEEEINSSLREIASYVRTAVQSGRNTDLSSIDYYLNQLEFLEFEARAVAHKKLDQIISLSK